MREKVATQLISFFLFFVLLFLFLRLVGPLPLTINSVTTTKTQTFNVTGEGTATAKPDIATITVGVQADDNTVADVQNQLNTNINKVTSAIKNLGVKDQDIQTSNYNISPNYNYLSGNQKIQGYSASTNLVIKIHDLSKVNQVIDAATSNGANQVGGVSFDVSDKAQAEDQARQQAIDQAKQKAQDAARIAGFKLGRLINYSEDFGQQLVPLPMMGVAADKAVASPSTQVQPGSNEIQVTVTLSYEID